MAEISERDIILLQQGFAIGVQQTLSMIMLAAQKGKGELPRLVEVMVVSVTQKMQELGLLDKDFKPTDTLSPVLEKKAAAGRSA